MEEEKKKFGLKDIAAKSQGSGSRRDQLQAAGMLVQGDDAEAAAAPAAEDEGMGLGRKAKVGEILLAAIPALAGLAVGGTGGGAIGAKVGADALGGILKDEKETSEAKAKSAAELAKEDRQYKRDLELQRLKGEQAKQIKGMENKNEKAPKEPLSTQRLAAGYAKRVEMSQGILDKLETEGKMGTGLGTTLQKTFLPEIMQSDEIKMRDQAERNFINAVLRRESGASIQPSEFASSEKQYFARPGDPPELLAQKRQNRQIALAALMAEAGDTALADIGGKIQGYESKNPRSQDAAMGLIDEANAGDADLEQLPDAEIDRLLNEARSKAMKRKGGR